MSQRKNPTLQRVAGALLGGLFVACSGSAPPAPEAPEAVEAVEPVSPTLVAAKLAGADLVDGAEDFVVSRCPGCGLGMQGSADHSLQVEGYELHFCSDSCQHRFEEDALAEIARLEIPEP